MKFNTPELKAVPVEDKPVAQVSLGQMYNCLTFIEKELMVDNVDKIKILNLVSQLKFDVILMNNDDNHIWRNLND